MKRAPIFDVELREAQLERNGYLRQQLDKLGTKLLRADRRRKAQAPKPPAPKPKREPEPRRRPYPLSIHHDHTAPSEFNK
jgi:hypothetical protein